MRVVVKSVHPTGSHATVEIEGQGGPEHLRYALPLEIPVKLGDVLEVTVVNTTEGPEAATEQIPDDFPGAAALRAAGYTTLDEVAALATEDRLTEVPGIGEATAEKIEKAL